MRVVLLHVFVLATVLFAAQSVTFPPISSTNLNGDELQLPGSFTGERNLVLIAFKREQQKEIDTWLAFLPKLKQSHAGLAWYELPTITKMNALTRWFINNGMRGGIPDKQQRARTITLYIDKKPFRDALQLPSEDRIYALLLNQAGEVIWRAEGVYSEEKGKSLEEALSR